MPLATNEPDAPTSDRPDAAELHRRIAALDAERKRLRRQAAVAGTGRTSQRDTRQSLSAQLRDVTAQLAASRAALRDSEGWHRLICESAADYAIITADLSGRVTNWNIGARNLFGWDEDEAMGQALSMIFVPEDCAAAIPEAEMQGARQAGRAEDERWHQRKDGSRFWASGLLMPLRDDGETLGYLKIVRDQTSRRQAEGALQQALAEKDLLMREMHHRVKNSLQMVHNLLALQARAADDPDLEACLMESAVRVRTIAAIHDRLYRGDSVLSIEIAPYLSGLVEDLKAGMASTLQNREITLNSDQAVWPAAEVPTLGLVLTELVTNALKYGKGTVGITFHHPADGSPVLTVEDEGRDLAADFDPKKSHGLGMRLITGLLRSPEGRLTIDRSGGKTRFVAHLPHPLARE